MFLQLFKVWIGVFSVSFLFLPILLVLDWRKRGTAEGFSSVVLIIPMIIQAFWLRLGWMTNDTTQILINSMNVSVLSCYIAAYAYYQPKRRHLKAAGNAKLWCFDWTTTKNDIFCSM
ncbi:Protein CBG07302 [Caenorhabditis briggsae]|uniref:Protein CBG07302 n=1 Tax=Caenorhabditis briggsae TaxID=6238 RepID=A8X521_CAEBR|nr:Protein CBG07302 [Caenorhabditis briggsae]CAP27731.1 Protein CBG07302 [Caenorhabditis briggsae]